jgi:sugar-specific transcriptional regulator TrmB
LSRRSDDNTLNELRKELEKLKSELENVTRERDTLKSELDRIRVEEGAAKSIEEVTLSFQQAIIAAEEKILQLNKPKVFTVADISVDLKAVVLADGKLVLPTSPLLAAERLATIHLNLKPIPGKIAPET